MSVDSGAVLPCVWFDGGGVAAACPVLTGDIGAGIGVGGAVRRLASHSSRNDDPDPELAGWGLVAGGKPAGLAPNEPVPPAGAAYGLFPNGAEAPPIAPARGGKAGLGSSWVVRRAKISFSTLAFGLPYFAAESCLSAAAS